MRDDLFSFTFRGHRVCVSLDSSATLGWSFSIDGDEEPPAPIDLTLKQRTLLEDAGMAARDRIRLMVLATGPVNLKHRHHISPITPSLA